MKFCVDENIPRITVDELRRLGHDVLDIRESPKQGLTDDLLWKEAQSEHRILVTTDKGFVSHRNENHHGVLIVRLRQPNEQKIHARVLQALNQFPEKNWPGLLVVMRDRVQSVWRALN
jgi:predicted nuclease of predicted toxin-antitoxin system